MSNKLDHTYEGKCHHYWADNLGITIQAIGYRIKKLGSLEMAVKMGSREKAAVSRSKPKKGNDLDSYIFNTVILGISHETHTELRLKVKRHREEIRRIKE